MQSLHAKLLWGVSLGTAAIWLVFGVMLHTLISRTLWSEFDASLADKARSLVAMTDQDEEGLGFDPLEEPLPEFAPSPHAEYFQIWLTDGTVTDGTVFARSPSLRERDLPRRAGTYDAPAFDSVTLPDRRAGRIVGITFIPSQECEHTPTVPPMTVTLVIARDIVGLQSTLARMRNGLIGVCVMALALSSAVMTWIVRRSLQPINHLVTQISAVGADDLATRISSAGIPSELSPVIDRLNDLLARLDAAFQRERRFTGDVAHELRTPLAGLRAKLELALSRDRSADEYRKTVDDCLRIDLHMQRMVENLLHLARADAGQLEVRREPVDIREVVQECWGTVEKKAQVRGLNMDWCGNGVGMVNTDRDHLHLIIQNILDNAIAYANAEGCITVSTGVENGTVALTIANTGCTLSSDQIHRVFDRFWRGDSSFRQSDEAHCGLGLPLCRAVIEQLDGSITAAVTPAGVFTITIRLPFLSSSHPLILASEVTVNKIAIHPLRTTDSARKSPTLDATLANDDNITT